MEEKEKSKWEKMREEKEKKKKESEAYKKIVEARTLAERRRAYEKEALKVASEKGAALARKKSFRELLAERISGATRQKISGTLVRKTPVKRVVRRRAPVRRVVRRRAPASRTPVRRRAPIRRAPVRRAPASRTPVRRRAPIRRAPVRRAPVQTGYKPINISDFI